MLSEAVSGEVLDSEVIDLFKGEVRAKRAVDYIHALIYEFEETLDDKDVLVDIWMNADEYKVFKRYVSGSLTIGYLYLNHISQSYLKRGNMGRFGCHELYVNKDVEGIEIRLPNKENENA